MSIQEEINEMATKSKLIAQDMDVTVYFDMVTKNPTLAASAHKRIYDMIREHGVEVNEEGQEVYKYFSKELFGIESSTKEIMEYIKGAALGSDVGKRFLLLYGPPSSGKSNILSMLKDDLEKWTRTDKGALYGIQGCPLNEDPLHLIPKSLRDKFEAQTGVKIEGELCPVCSWKLKNELGNDFTKFKAQRVFFSQQDRCGIGTFVPSDPKSQDIAELVGSVNLSTLGEYGTESHPKAYRFDGELNIANRGLMEFVEILKVDQKFLYILITATQEKNIKTPRFPLISCDLAIISHTNESEYKEFVGNAKNEALIDRMVVCRVPYNLIVNQEIKIYEKLMRNGNTKNLHIAPHALRVAAMFAVLSRLEKAKDANLDVVKKMKLYNGEDVDGYHVRDVARIRRESNTEGMDGISPRYIINRLATTAIRGEGESSRTYITPTDVLKALKDGIGTSSKFKAEEKSRYDELLGFTKEQYDHIAKNEVQKAFFVSFEEEAQTLMDKYIDNVESYLEKSKIKDKFTGEEIEPDEKFMRNIESKIKISEIEKDSFRNEIMRKFASSLKRNEKFRYSNHGKLREAIEKQLFEDRRDTIKITITSTNSKDPKSIQDINRVIDCLCKEHGYIPESANELLEYVSSIMAREK